MKPPFGKEIIFKRKRFRPIKLILLFLLCLFTTIILTITLLSENIALAPHSKIPKIIHQSWKNKILPNKFQKWSATWIKHHPTWEYNLWTDEDNRNMVEQHFPWFLQTYEKFPDPVQKADTARYMYMYKFGGIYADLDVECIASLETLISKMEMGLCLMGESDWEHSTPNSWIASKPGTNTFELF